VVHEGGGAGVGEQVRELVGDVAVVDVERRRARRVAAEHRLEVLRSVQQVQADGVLPSLPRTQLAPLGVATEAVVGEDRPEPAGPVVDLGVGAPGASPDDALTVGHGGGDGVEDRPQVVLHGADPARDEPRM
jgi:hypothetical protein